MGPADEGRSVLILSDTVSQGVSLNLHVIMRNKRFCRFIVNRSSRCADTVRLDVVFCNVMRSCDMLNHLKSIISIGKFRGRKKGI